MAIQFVITRRAGGGVRLVSEVLELCGLSAFVGASYGSQQALNAALEQAVVDIAAEQRQALAVGMAPREITVCEGRNGQLSLFHPGCHRLSARQLAALTAVPNFYIQRPDPTTAAERFFGRAPPLFEQRLQRVPLPPRLRRRRARTPQLSYLMPLDA